MLAAASLRSNPDGSGRTPNPGDYRLDDSGRLQRLRVWPKVSVSEQNRNRSALA
jgi:hypothetical protein